MKWKWTAIESLLVCHLHPGCKMWCDILGSFTLEIHQMSQLLQVNIHFFWSSRLHWTLYTQKLCWQKQGGKRWQQRSEKPAIPSETNSFVINVVTQIWQFLKDLKNQNVWPIDSQMTFSDSHNSSCVSQRHPFGELSEISLWLNYDVVQKDSRFSCDNIYS